MNPLTRPRGFCTENNLKTREFVTKLYDIIKNSDIELIMTQAQAAIKADEAIEKIGGLLDEADRIMTKGIPDAEAAVRPPHKAASHIWSPELAKRQRKAALGKKYAIAMRKPMTRTLRSTFEAEAKAIDPSWELPVLERAVMAKRAEALTKQARKAMRDQRKLRMEFLEKKLRSRRLLKEIRCGRTIGLFSGD